MKKNVKKNARKGDIIKKIMESGVINDYYKSFYIEGFVKGEFTVSELAWIWEFYG